MSIDHYDIDLSFVHNKAVLEDAVLVSFDPFGYIRSYDNGKTSFKLQRKDIPILNRRFDKISTLSGADFEPVAKALIGLYRDMKERPAYFEKRIDYAKFLATR